METVANFLGRFHPLLVHLPIGSLILAFLFDAISLSKTYRRLQLAVQPALVFGAVAALLSVVTGLAISQEGGYTDQTLTLHQYAGIATTVLAFILVYLRRNRSVLNYERQTRKPIRFLFSIPLIISLTLTGHWGGSLTHGEEFLTAVSLGNEIKTDPLAKIQLIAKIDEALVYGDVIQPILESKCYSCHSAAKQKGDLRLDSQESILKGGKNGIVVHAGMADSSALFARMMLPLEDEDHMPPNEKPQPSAAELDLLRLWINEGAPFSKTVKELKEAHKAIQYANLLVESINTTSWIPKDEVEAVSQVTLDKLKAEGAIVIPVGQNTNYLHVNFTNVRSLSERAIQSLKSISDQLVSLRFSYCQFENNDLAFLNDFKHLTWLFLDHTNVNDTSFKEIKQITSLKYLNLVFTDVSDKIFAESPFPELERLYVFQTKFSSEAVAVLQQANPNLKIDTGGIMLPKLASDTIIYKKKS